MKQYDPKLNLQWETYYKARNIQIAFWKIQGDSWETISKRVGLHKEYIKELSHKLGIYGKNVIVKRDKV